jgi:hypothetical protein
MTEDEHVEQGEDGRCRKKQDEVCAPAEAINERGAATSQDIKERAAEDEHFKDEDEPRDGEITPPQL